MHLGSKESAFGVFVQSFGGGDWVIGGDGVVAIADIEIELTALFVGDGGGNARMRAFVNNQNVSFCLGLFF